MNAQALIFGIGGSALFVVLYVLASSLEWFWLAFPLFVLSFAAMALAGDRIKKLVD